MGPGACSNRVEFLICDLSTPSCVFCRVASQSSCERQTRRTRREPLGVTVRQTRRLFSSLALSPCTAATAPVTLASVAPVNATATPIARTAAALIGCALISFPLTIGRAAARSGLNA